MLKNLNVQSKIITYTLHTYKKRNTLSMIHVWSIFQTQNRCIHRFRGLSLSTSSCYCKSRIRPSGIASNLRGAVEVVEARFAASSALRCYSLDAPFLLNMDICFVRSILYVGKQREAIYEMSRAVVLCTLVKVTRRDLQLVINYNSPFITTVYHVSHIITDHSMVPY